MPKKLENDQVNIHNQRRRGGEERGGRRGVIRSQSFYKYVERVRNSTFQISAKLEWHASDIANSNVVSLNYDNCNDMYPIKSSSDSMIIISAGLTSPWLARTASTLTQC
jgi:hypothetical protein